MMLLPLVQHCQTELMSDNRYYYYYYYIRYEHQQKKTWELQFCITMAVPTPSLARPPKLWQSNNTSQPESINVGRKLI